MDICYQRVTVGASSKITFSIGELRMCVYHCKQQWGNKAN